VEVGQCPQAEFYWQNHSGRSRCPAARPRIQDVRISTRTPAGQDDSPPESRSFNLVRPLDGEYGLCRWELGTPRAAHRGNPSPELQ